MFWRGEIKTIVCVDNTLIVLQSLKENANKAYLYTDVQTFLSAELALDNADKFGYEYSFVRSII